MFEPGTGQDLTDVVARGRIADFGGECLYGDDRVDVVLNVVMVAERGPASTEEEVPFRYFVAVVSPGGEILAREIFEAPARFQQGADRGVWSEALSQTIPLPDGALNGPQYEILLGFQLTPEQLRYNQENVLDLRS